MKPIALPANTPIVSHKKRAEMIVKGMIYTDQLAKQQVETATRMLQTLEFSTQVADTTMVGTHQRQREFQNVATLAEATNSVARTLLEAAKVMAGLSAVEPATVLLQQNNYYAPQKPKRKKGSVTIDNEASAFSVFD